MPLKTDLINNILAIKPDIKGLSSKNKAQLTIILQGLTSAEEGGDPAVLLNQKINDQQNRINYLEAKLQTLIDINLERDRLASRLNTLNVVMSNASIDPSESESDSEDDDAVYWENRVFNTNSTIPRGSGGGIRRTIGPSRPNLINYKAKTIAELKTLMDVVEELAETDQINENANVKISDGLLKVFNAVNGNYTNIQR